MEVFPYTTHERAAVLALAPRLCAGVAEWRRGEGVAAAAREWVEDSVSSQDDADAVFVARVDGQVVGMVSVSEQRHWSGDLDAYVGELVTEQSMEGQGVGRALVARAERWAGDRGLSRITLETGAANSRALAFYERLGYRREEVRLTRRLT